MTTGVAGVAAADGGGGVDDVGTVLPCLCLTTDSRLAADVSNRCMPRLFD